MQIDLANRAAIVTGGSKGLGFAIATRLAASGADVLNIGAKAPRAGSGPTTISRAAGMALTKLLSIEGAPHNILVNAMLVGFIEADQHVQRAAKEGIPLA